MIRSTPGILTFAAALASLPLPLGFAAGHFDPQGAPDAATPAGEASAPVPDAAAKRWRSELTAWIWIMGVDGEVGARGTSADVNASFGDVLEASDSVFAFSGRLEAGYGRLAGFVDGFFADIGVEDQTGPQGVTGIDVGFQQSILDFGLMYRIGDWEPSGQAAANDRNLTLDLYGGARYSSVELDLEAPGVGAASADDEWLDPIVGAKLVLPLSERWHLQLNGDVGGFGVESDFTWSTTAAFGWNFTMFGLPATALAGYRAIGWDYTSGGAGQFRFDVIQHGPILGLSVRF